MAVKTNAMNKSLKQICLSLQSQPLLFFFSLVFLHVIKTDNLDTSVYVNADMKSINIYIILTEHIMILESIR